MHTKKRWIWTNTTLIMASMLPRVMLVGVCRGRGLQSNGGRGGDNWSGY